LFTSVADRYDEFRPGYPDDLFDDLGVLAGLTASSRLVEVGPGTGQATRGLLEHGWDVFGVEPGTEMADLVRRRFQTERFTLERVRFEDFRPAELVDLVFSATAFHWVDPDLRWSKAASVLRPGGHLALATHRSVLGGTIDDLYDAAGDLHARYAPEMEYIASPSEADLIGAVRADASDIGKAWFAAEFRAGDTAAAEFFGGAELRFYRSERRYDAAGAIGLISTFSPYLALAPERSAPLLAGMEALIRDRFEGAVTAHYLTILAVAPRRDSAAEATT
jgi:SAM-dependent methyltransferase